MNRGEIPTTSGLEEIFEEISPIEDFQGSMSLSFRDHRFEPPKYSIGECKERDMTYSQPLFVTAEFTNNITGEIKSQTVFMGDFPVMTPRGTFVINGTERVVVSQLVRSPGVYFERTIEKTSDKDIFSSKIIPSRGAWLEFEVDKKDFVGVRIDRKRKQSVTLFLKALGWTEEQILEEFGDFDSMRQTLEKDTVIGEAFGELASGLVGMGRMAEPETIVETIEQHLLEGLPLYGKKILVTAGPTHEAIDPVRYIGNHSSGRMGFEIANTAAQSGAEVILISGPTHYKALYDSIQTIPITSARDMYDAAHQYFKDVDAAILSAAVADYRPKFPAVSKLKKKSSSLVLELEKTEDVLASLGEIKEKQLLIGFALETENEVANAIKKLKAKNLDLIILNSLNDDGAGFGGSTNKISIIDKDLNQTNYPLKSKSEVADDIINELIKRVHA